MSTSSPAVGSTTTERTAEYEALLESLRFQLVQLRAALVASEAPTAASSTALLITRPLTLGSRGDDVASLQRFLKARDYFDYPEITGYFGPVTRKAVAEFQRAYGLEPVGSVGPLTRAKIAELTRVLTPEASPLVPEAATSSIDTSATSSPAGSSIAIAATSTYAPGYGGGGGSGGGGSDSTPAPDTSAPSIPSGLLVSASTPNSVTLSWTASTDNVGVSSYTIYRDDSAVGSAAGTTYTDTGLSAGIAYTYTIAADDAAGNTSATSSSVSTTTPTTETYVYKPLRVGAGGYVTGMDIAGDGTKVVRTDTYGAYLWDDTTLRWKQLVTSSRMPAEDVAFGNNAGVYEIRIAPSNTNRLYMMYRGRVYRSDNQGTTWARTSFSQVTVDANDGYRIYGQKMAVDPANADVVYVGTPQNGLWVTDDGGTTWAQVPTASVPVSQAVSGVYPGITGIVFATTSGTTLGKTNEIYVSSYGNGVYRSTDAGENWSHLTAATGPSLVFNAKVGVDGRYYASTYSNAKLWRYATSTWTDITPVGSRAFFAIAPDPANASRIVAIDDAGNVNKTINGGASWVATTDPTKHTLSARDIPWLATTNAYLASGDAHFDPSDTNKLYLSMGIGVLTASPSDASLYPIAFNSQSMGIEQLVANDIIAPVNGTPIVGSWDRPFFSITNPDSFPTQYGPESGQFNAGWALDYATSDPSTVVGLVNWGGTYKSGYTSNGGQSWTIFPTQPTTAKLGGSIAASTPSNIIVIPENNGWPLYTTNGGSSWTQIDLPGVPTSGETGWGFAYYLKRFVVAADRVNANTFYMYNYGPTGATSVAGLYKSTDGGSNWTKVYDGQISTASGFNAKLRSVPGKAGHLFFTSGNMSAPHPNAAGYFKHSTDGGATWTTIPSILEVQAFGFGKAATADGYPAIYAVGWVDSEYGIWRSDDEGQTWAQIGTWPTGSVDVVAAISGDMDTYGTVYIGFGGSGYAYGVRSADATNQHTISVYQAANGTISPGTTAVASGGSQTFTITPNSGYEVASVWVNGVDQGAVSSYAFSGVMDEYTISATFSAIPAPSTPTGFAAVSSSTSVSLSWNDVSNEDNYVIERSLTSSSGFSPIATTSADVTSYDDTGLSAGVYYYRMKAVNSGGGSAYTSAVAGIACGSCEAPSSGLIAYWALDGNGTDSSGNGYNGTVTGATTTFTTGKIDQAVSFDGSANNYIAMGSVLNSLDGAITLAAWINRSGNSGTGGAAGGVIGKVNGSNNNDPYAVEIANSGTGQANKVVVTTGLLSDTQIESTATITNGAWYHLVFTWDGSTKTIYVNGIQDKQESATGSVAGTESLYIGFTRGFGNGANYMNGLIDDVRVYDRALTASEVAQLYGFGQ